MWKYLILKLCMFLGRNIRVVFTYECMHTYILYVSRHICMWAGIHGNVCMFSCLYVCMHAGRHVCMHMYACMYVHMYISGQVLECTSVSACVYVLHTCMYECMHACVACIYICMLVGRHAWFCLPMYILVHTWMHVYMFVHQVSIPMSLYIYLTCQ